MAKRVISHKDFVRDLGRGAVGEDVVEEFFKKEFQVVLKNTGAHTKGWDFELDGVVETAAKLPKVDEKKLLAKFKKHLGETIEVKYDEAAAKYGNFFIEFLFDEETGKAGAIPNCKADLIVWVVPSKKGKFKVYLFKRAELLAWLFVYVLERQKKLEVKSPAISPRAKGIVIPIKDAIEGFSCLGEFTFKF
jgi:hypothetical protein